MKTSHFRDLFSREKWNEIRFGRLRFKFMFKGTDKVFSVSFCTFKSRLPTIAVIISPHFFRMPSLRQEQRIVQDITRERTIEHIRTQATHHLQCITYLESNHHSCMPKGATNFQDGRCSR